MIDLERVKTRVKDIQRGHRNCLPGQCLLTGGETKVLLTVIRDLIEEVERLQLLPSILEGQLVAILSCHCGERGTSEGAAETLERIIREKAELGATNLALLHKLREQAKEADGLEAVEEIQDALAKSRRAHDVTNERFAKLESKLCGIISIIDQELSQWNSEAVMVFADRIKKALSATSTLHPRICHCDRCESIVEDALQDHLKDSEKE